MPQIMPPINWLRAVRVFMMRPAAKAPTMRGTRISRVSALTRTSTNSAPNAYISFLPSGPPAMRGLAGVELLDRVGLAPSGDEFGIFLDRADAERA